MIRLHQVDPKWIIRRVFRAGQARALAEARKLKVGAGTTPSILAIPRWRLRRIVKLFVLTAFHRVKGPKQGWFRNAYAASHESDHRSLSAQNTASARALWHEPCLAR